MAASDNNKRNKARSERGRWQVHIVAEGLPLQASSVLLMRGDQRVLVDTGFPTLNTVIDDGLRKVGLRRDQITGIISTHFHLDHIGCNALFPQAWVYASRRDYEWAVPIYESVCGGETRREVFRKFYPEVTDEDFDFMEEARLLQLIQWMWDPTILGDLKRYRWLENSSLDLEGIDLVPTPGHTPGHISVEVHGTDANYLIAGDARAFLNNSGPDMPPHNQREFQRSLALLRQFEGILIPGHDAPFVQTPPDSESDEARPVRRKETARTRK